MGNEVILITSILFLYLYEKYAAKICQKRQFERKYLKKNKKSQKNTNSES